MLRGMLDCGGKVRKAAFYRFLGCGQRYSEVTRKLEHEAGEDERIEFLKVIG